MDYSPLQDREKSLLAGKIEYGVRLKFQVMLDLAQSAVY